MLDAVTGALSSVIGWVGEVVSALTTTDGALNALLPLLSVGIAVACLHMAISAIKGFIWGA